MKKHTLALLLCLCAPTLAAPHLPTAAPLTISAAEWAYTAQIEGHTQKISATLRRLAALCQSPHFSGKDWKQQMTVTLRDVQTQARQGRTFHAPPRFQAVQQAYSPAMGRYEAAVRGMPAAVQARDGNALLHSTDEIQQANAAMQRAITLLHTLEQPPVRSGNMR